MLNNAGKDAQKVGTIFPLPYQALSGEPNTGNGAMDYWHILGSTFLSRILKQFDTTTCLLDIRNMLPGTSLKFTKVSSDGRRTEQLLATSSETNPKHFSVRIHLQMKSDISWQMQITSSKSQRPAIKIMRFFSGFNYKIQDVCM